MTDCRSTEWEKSSSVGVDNWEYGLEDTAPASSDNEDGNLHIQSMFENIYHLPRHVYRSMKADDVTSNSTVTSQEWTGSESAVLCTFDYPQHAMKYRRSEDSSIPNNSISLFSLEAYSPMNREEKVKHEESDTSHAFSQSVSPVRSVASRPRILNSCWNQPNISDSKCPNHPDSIYNVVMSRDDA